MHFEYYNGVHQFQIAEYLSVFLLNYTEILFMHFDNFFSVNVFRLVTFER